jgi:hypothetical protein
MTHQTAPKYLFGLLVGAAAFVVAAASNPCAAGHSPAKNSLMSGTTTSGFSSAAK